MKITDKTISPVLALLLAMGGILCVSATVRPGYPEMPPCLDGSMTLIDLGEDQSLRDVGGDTLTPVFVNYLGRHGARYLSSEKKVDKLMSFLAEAQDAGALTPHGEAFMELLRRVAKSTGGRWGALDSIGKEEQRALARQMHGLFPDLLESGRVDAEATYVPRVVMSMYEFCHELGRLSPDLDIYTSAGKQNNAELRYFTVNPEYVEYLKDGSWREVLKEYEERGVPEAPAARLVKEPYRADGSRLRALTLDMYGVLQSLRATGMGAPDTRWMSEEEYAACWRADNLDHFLSRTANTISPIPGEAAAPLLRSFISYGDSVSEGKGAYLRAMLRFAHAETLMPLFSLMRIEGCYSDSGDLSHIFEKWRDYDVVPLGANLIVAMMRGDSGKTYAAMRLNGRWVSPCADGRLLAGWDELRQFWLRSLAELTAASEP